jgi:putative transposase
MSHTRLRYHIITVTKNRTPWITPDVEPAIYEILREQATRQGAKILALGGVEDHVHWVVAIPPKFAVSEVVGNVKSDTTKAVRKLEGLGEFEWGAGYGGFSLNPWDMEKVVKYVQEQKKRHGRGKVWEVLERVEE